MVAIYTRMGKLDHMVKLVINGLKDSFDFLSRVSNLNSDNKVIASLNVKILFTNVFVDFGINLLLQGLFSRDVKKLRNTKT